MAHCEQCDRQLASDPIRGIAFCDDRCAFLYVMHLNVTKPPISEDPVAVIRPGALTVADFFRCTETFRCDTSSSPSPSP